MGMLGVDVLSIGLLSAGALSICLSGAHVLSVYVMVAIGIGVDVPGVIGEDIGRVRFLRQDTSYTRTVCFLCSLQFFLLLCTVSLGGPKIT
jgi:hypothetical protein